MLPTWLTVELALLPLFVGGLIWLVRLEAKVKHNRADIERLEREKKERAKAQGEHNDRLYTMLRKLDNNLHLIMGKMGVEPLD